MARPFLFLGIALVFWVAPSTTAPGMRSHGAPPAHVDAPVLGGARPVLDRADSFVAARVTALR